MYIVTPLPIGSSAKAVPAIMAAAAAPASRIFVILMFCFSLLEHAAFGLDGNVLFKHMPDALPPLPLLESRIREGQVEVLTV